MTKQILTAARDIKKGEPLTMVVLWEEGYFHFFDKTGTAYKAQHAKKALTPEQKLEKEKREQAHAQAVQKRKQERKLKKELREMASKEAKEARKKLKEYKIKEQIAKLEEKKAKL